LREILGASTRFGFSVAEVDTQRETEQAGAIDLRLRVTGRASVTGLVATLSELDGVLTVGAGEPEDESE
jgi:acetolactate synthase regulatory subunit